MSTIAAEMAGVFSMSAICGTSDIRQMPALKPRRLIPTSIASPPMVVTMSACIAARLDVARSP